MEEYKALEVFEQLATPLQWSTHLILKSKMKLYGTKSKNYLAATKRVEYDSPPKFISNIDFTFKIDESIFNKDEAQALYTHMRHITKEYRIQAMSLYVQSTNRERDIQMKSNISLKVSREILKKMTNKGTASRGRNQRTRRRNNCPDTYSIVGRGFLPPTIINETKTKLSEEEYELLKSGLRFICNDPKTASRRRATKLAILKQK
ncbi:unnamed protein product, partial [Rotaria magnacalcarata]